MDSSLVLPIDDAIQSSLPQRTNRFTSDVSIHSKDTTNEDSFGPLASFPGVVSTSSESSGKTSREGTDATSVIRNVESSFVEAIVPANEDRSNLKESVATSFYPACRTTPFSASEAPPTRSELHDLKSSSQIRPYDSCEDNEASSPGAYQEQRPRAHPAQMQASGDTASACDALVGSETQISRGIDHPTSLHHGIERGRSLQPYDEPKISREAPSFEANNLVKELINNAEASYINGEESKSFQQRCHNQRNQSIAKSSSIPRKLEHSMIHRLGVRLEGSALESPESLPLMIVSIPGTSSALGENSTSIKTCGSDVSSLFDFPETPDITSPPHVPKSNDHQQFFKAEPNLIQTFLPTNPPLSEMEINVPWIACVSPKLDDVATASQNNEDTGMGGDGDDLKRSEQLDSASSDTEGIFSSSIEVFKQQWKKHAQPHKLSQWLTPTSQSFKTETDNNKGLDNKAKLFKVWNSGCACVTPNNFDPTMDREDGNQAPQSQPVKDDKDHGDNSIFRTSIESLENLVQSRVPNGVGEDLVTQATKAAPIVLNQISELLELSKDTIATQTEAFKAYREASSQPAGAPKTIPKCCLVSARLEMMKRHQETIRKEAKQ